jgi:predicted transcriptional regulator
MARPRVYSEEQADQLFLIYRELDVTLREMSDELGIPQTTIWKLINGKRSRAKRPYTREERRARHREAAKRYRARHPERIRAYYALPHVKRAKRAKKRSRRAKAREEAAFQTAALARATAAFRQKQS